MLRVFIHHDGALGDVLLSLPCFSALRSEGDLLQLAARPDVCRLLKETGWVDEAISSDSGLFAPLYSGVVDARTGAFFGRFDRVFLFTVDPGSTLAAACRKAVPGTMTILTVPPMDDHMHAAVFRFLQLGRVAPFPGGPFLRPPRWSSDLVAALLKRSGYDGTGPLIAVHPGSGGRSKCWPLERYEALIGCMQRELDAFVVVLTGPAEDDLLMERMERFSRGTSRMIHLCNTELTIVAALLHGCELYVGNDSGISHLAAAAGCPGVVLFGPTSPILWGPVGPAVSSLVSPSLANLEVGTVLQHAVMTLRMPLSSYAIQN